jgi:peptidoglycan hydrolase-like protein with peptidoglycan-binding domain
MKKYTIAAFLFATTFISAYAITPYGLNLSADGVSVPNGGTLIAKTNGSGSTGSAMLRWGSGGVESCRISILNNGAPTSSASPDNNPVVTGLVNGQAGSMVCTSPDGQTATLSFTVSVVQSAAVTPITLSATVNGYPVTPGNYVKVASGQNLSVAIRNSGATNCYFYKDGYDYPLEEKRVSLGSQTLTPANTAVLSNISGKTDFVYHCVNNSSTVTRNTAQYATKNIQFSIIVDPSYIAQAPASSAADEEEEDDDNQGSTPCVDIPGSVVLNYATRNSNPREYVLQLQGFLKDRGYLTGQTTGFFGDGTRNALKAFQAANGFRQTGSTGNLTKARIKSLTCGGSGSNGSGQYVAPPASQTPTTPSLRISGAPNGFKTVTSNESISLSWGVNGASSYRLNTDAPGYSSDTEYTLTNGSWTGTMASLNITSGTSMFSVSACNANNVCSPYSNKVSVTVTAPSAVQAPVISTFARSSGSTKRVTLTGTGFTSNNTVYLDGYSATADRWYEVANNVTSTANGSTLSFTLPEDSPCPTYRSGGVGCPLPGKISDGGHTITVSNENGISNTFSFTFNDAVCNSSTYITANGTCASAGTTAPQTPTLSITGAPNGSKTVTSAESISLSWAVAGASSYKLNTDAPGYSADTEYTLPNGSWTGTMASLNITSGTSVFRVSACNANNVCSEYSNNVSVTVTSAGADATTAASYVPNTPNLQFSGTGAGSASRTVTSGDYISLGWLVNGATSYKFKTDAPGYSQDTEYVVTNATWSGTMASLGVTSGTSVFSVKACNASGACSAYSNQVSVTVTSLSASETQTQLLECSNATSNRGQAGQSYNCKCSPNFVLGSVWGTGTYTDDSGICAAALHAGVVTRAAGGNVRYTMSAGQSSYTGSTSNGVASASYGSWYGSYTIAGAATQAGTNPVVDTARPTYTSSITASNITSTSATISWAASTDNVGVASYKVYRGLAPNGSLNLVTTLSGNTLSYTDTGLTQGTGYRYIVYSLDAAGNQSVSPVTSSGDPAPGAILAVTTLSSGTPAQAPTVTDLVVNPASVGRNDSFVISMQPAEVPNSSFYYEYKVNGSNFMRVASQFHTASGMYSNGFTPSLLQLTAGQTYTIAARTCNSVGCGSVATKTLTVTAPAATQAPTVTDLVVNPSSVGPNDSFVISMQPAEVPNSSFYYEYKVNGNNFMRVASQFHTASGMYSSGFTPSALGLTAGQTYTIVGRTCNSVGCGSTASKTLTVTAPTTAQVVPGTETPNCPSSATGNRGLTGQSFTCKCSPNFVLGSVWGTGTYTDDSGICAAALHAGVITRAAGGNVRYTMTAGQSSYTSSTSNGVASAPWGSWPSGYTVSAGPTSYVNTSNVVATKASKGMVLGDYAACIDLPTNFHRGSESKAVKSLQTFLTQKGYFVDEISGFYGDKTVDAVKDYQLSKDLPATGMVFDFTRIAIKNDTCR